MNLNKDQWYALLRHVLTYGGGLLTAHGVATNAQVQDIIGGLMAAIQVIISIYDKMHSRTLDKAAVIMANH